jgi:hypothetical protein
MDFTQTTEDMNFSVIATETQMENESTEMIEFESMQQQDQPNIETLTDLQQTDKTINHQ